jgi:hypothetical protein
MYFIASSFQDGRAKDEQRTGKWTPWMPPGAKYPSPISAYLPWEITGTYLEACNCAPICPCRAVDGKRGGRSTYGVCMGALSWQIERGRAGEIDLSGLRVLLALRYDDDEPGSPWTFFLYVDERGDESQRDALSQIFLGQIGGTPQDQFPWVWKASDLQTVRAVSIDLDHAPGRGWFRTGAQVSVRIRAPLEDEAKVTCVIPGHHRSGRELHADLIKVEDGELSFEFSDRCGYESSFQYSSSASD